MFRKAMLLSGLALSAFQFSCVAEDLPPATRWVPPEAALVLEVSDPGRLLNPLLEPEVGTAFQAAVASQKPNLKLQQFEGIVAYLELQLGINWRTGLRQLAGRNLTLAVDPKGGPMLVIDGQDEKLLQQLHEIARHFATTEAMKQHQPERVGSRDYQGATLWTLTTNEAHVLCGPRLLLAAAPAPLEHALDLRSGSNAPSIASTPFYTAAQQALGKEPVARLFLNLQTLRLLPNVKEALAADDNPLSMLLFADTKEALRQANWLAIGAYVNHGSLILRAFTDGQASPASKSASFTLSQKPADGPLPNLIVPGRIASLSLFRDLHTFYAAKDELFPERTSGLIFFENMMGIFFSGIDLTDGVLAETRPDLRVVVAAQRYDPAIGTPAVQIPAFAAVLRLRRPEKFGETFEEAWQKALGLANFTRGQQALPGLIIDHSAYQDVKYTLSYYRPPASDKEKATVEDRYNFRPTLARPGDYVILSSTDGLAKDLIDAVKRETSHPPEPLRNANGVAELDGAQLRTILLANRESMVRKNMLEKGNSRDQAESDIKLLLTIADCLQTGTLTLARENGRPQASLELKLKLPTAAPGTASTGVPPAREPKS